MVYFGIQPPFPLSYIQNQHAYRQMAPPCYENLFAIGNFHCYSAPKYAYYMAPPSLCQPVSQQFMESVQKNVTPFTKLCESILHCYLESDNNEEDAGCTSSLSDDDELQGCGQENFDEEDNGVADYEVEKCCASTSNDESAFGDDEDCTFTAAEISPSPSRSSTPDYFPFVSSMKDSEFPPLNDGLLCESGSSEESVSKPVSKSARRAFSRKNKWRVLHNGVLTESESGYQSEFSGQCSTGDGETDSRCSDPVHRNYSSVVANGSQSAGDVHDLKVDEDELSIASDEPAASSVPEEDISRMDLLSEHICEYYESVAQTEKTLLKKLRLRDMLYYSIAPIYPVCGLYVVGSSLNGFGNEYSDMDLCLVITPNELDQRKEAVEVLRMVERALSVLPVITEQKLILAKVPILRMKFSGPYSNITVDLNANNAVAIKNTHLLCYYAFFDWRLRPMVAVVKEWAKRCNINDASRSSFTSYSLVLMVIHYLQVGVEKPVLPSLQKLYPRRFNNQNDIRMLNVSLPLDDIPSNSTFERNDDVTLGELLIGFFHYYAKVYDYEKNAISIRLGSQVERKAILKNSRLQWSPIVIEEPFTHSNTAHSVYDERVFCAIKDKFQEAHEILTRTSDVNELLNVRPHSVAPAYAPYVLSA